MVEQTQRFNTALAASAISPNVFLGTLFMQPMSPSALRIGCTVPAAAVGDALATLTIGGRVVLLNAIVPVESVAGQGPVAQMGWFWTGVVLAGELIELIFRNQDAANAIVGGITTFAVMDPA